MASGLYLVTLLNDEPISVNANDPRRADKAIKVTRVHCKLGKARDLEVRARNYAKTFGAAHVAFRPIAFVDDIARAERCILRALAPWRLRGARRRPTEWLAGIDPQRAVATALDALREAGIAFVAPAET
ncbi:MAG: hypothetical protein J0L88_00880 [Xanthomonadales bacterium]|nr:hypothetical protein [Xanthomonadales bacterium]